MAPRDPYSREVTELGSVVGGACCKLGDRLVAGRDLWSAFLDVLVQVCGRWVGTDTGAVLPRVSETSDIVPKRRRGDGGYINLL